MKSSFITNVLYKVDTCVYKQFVMDIRHFASTTFSNCNIFIQCLVRANYVPLRTVLLFDISVQDWTNYNS